MAIIYARVRGSVMASKRKRINYQLKVFLPIVVSLWVIIIAVAVTLYRSEKDYRAEIIRSRIEFMNRCLLNIMENGEDPTVFLQFVDRYYKASVIDNLSMTLYDTATGEEKMRIGFPTPKPEQLNARGSIEGSFIAANNDDDSTYIEPDKAFYYSVNKSADGTLLVQTFMPLSSRIAAEIKGNPWLLISILVIAGAVTILIYISAHRTAKNIKLLRDFVSKAANDKDFVAVGDFANDDLGEISQQVVNIYNMRKAALAAREFEHRIALRATEERSNLKRQLTNNISHELKTPAGIIKGYVDTIIDNPTMDEQQRMHFMLKTREHVERLCDILNELSMMTRLEDGAQNIAVEKIDFRDFCLSLKADVEESGVIGDMAMVIDIAEGCFVKGNVTLLTGAIMNLVKNAVLYSKGTEIRLRLLTENQRFYTFVFADNGQGVPPESIPLLFERFYRVDKGRSRKVGGTGLGLPIVRSSLNTIGGTITVNNGKDGGLEFVFTLQKWRE